MEALEAKLATKNEVLSELMKEHVKLKKRTWGALKSRWVPHDVRDDVIDFVIDWAARTEFPMARFIAWHGG